MIKEIKLQVESGDRFVRYPAIIEEKGSRIYFLKSPFALKDEIKAMQGSKWHGYDEENPRKIWSIADTPRNRFQLGFLMGEPVYEWFDQDLVEHEFNERYADKMMAHQKDLGNQALTYHYHIMAAEMGTGKTLSAQAVIEVSLTKYPDDCRWWWIGPKSSLPNIKREFKKWGFDAEGIVTFMTYDELVKRMDTMTTAELEAECPRGVVFDESSRLKNATAQRTRAGQMLADMIRQKYGFDGYAILMSGTPSPKSPIDWWSQCEIAFPGFLREGSSKALQYRLAIMQKKDIPGGVAVNALLDWKDDDKKCGVCGLYAEEHVPETDEDPGTGHEFEPCKNEVAYLYDRLKGLVTVKHQKDCLSLPEKRYRIIECKPSSSVLRVAKALTDAAPNTITGITWLRELSDGFQYKDITEGTIACSHCQGGKIEEWFDKDDPERTFRSTDMLDPALCARLEKHEIDCPQCGGSSKMPKKVRITREVPCPKDKALMGLLEECEETGRIVIFAAFTGSIDRAMKLCRKEGWATVRCDGRGWEVTDHDGTPITNVEALDYWADRNNPRVAFVAHPESGGMSLTLTESRMAVFISNTNKPENRIQAEERIHRKGMDENLGCEIVDIFHLPSDRRVLELVRDNRRLELMTLGEFSQGVNWEE